MFPLKTLLVRKSKENVSKVETVSETIFKLSKEEDKKNCGKKPVKIVSLDP